MTNLVSERKRGSQFRCKLRPIIQVLRRTPRKVLMWNSKVWAFSEVSIIRVCVCESGSNIEIEIHLRVRWRFRKIRRKISWKIRGEMKKNSPDVGKFAAFMWIFFGCAQNIMIFFAGFIQSYKIQLFNMIRGCLRNMKFH